MEETKKRKQEEQQVDEGTPAKIAATKTDSESEDFLSNTVNSEISSGEEDPMDHQPTLPLTQREQTAPRSANSSTNTPKVAKKSTPNIDNKKILFKKRLSWLSNTKFWSFKFGKFHS